MKDGLINHLHLANYRVRISNKRQTSFEGQDARGGRDERRAKEMKRQRLGWFYAAGVFIFRGGVVPARV